MGLARLDFTLPGMPKYDQATISKSGGLFSKIGPPKWTTMGLPRLDFTLASMAKI